MMMMIHRQHPTVEVPPWDTPYEDPTTPIFSPQTNDYFSALKRYLPSSEFDDSDTESSDLPFDSFNCDNFRMYEFKVRKCARGRSHDWTECPYAHPGEKARRRDPRKYHYSGSACPEFRRGSCRKGDACEYAHGVFECWLHPARYRTQPCKDGPHCKRRVCFFAHSPEQLRVLPTLPESPPSHGGRLGCGEAMESPPVKVRGISGYSPTSVFEAFTESPPMSPSYDVSEIANAMRELHIKKFGMGVGPTAARSNVNMWGMKMGSPSSPRGGYMGHQMGPGAGQMGVGPSTVGSMPTTPTRAGRAGVGLFDPWAEEEEVPMERVESGRDLRARIYAKLSQENSLDRDRVDPASSGPDFGWVSELVK